MWERILNSKLVTKITHRLKKMVLPGFDGIPLYDVGVFFVRGIVNGSLSARASSIAFSFFLAIFPMIITFFTLIPFIPIENFHVILLDLIQQITPDTANDLISDTLNDIINRPSGGLLSFTFVLTLVFATNGIDNLIQAFNTTYHTIETRTLIKQRLIAILLFFIISIILVISIGLITLGSSIINYLFDHQLLTNWLTFFLIQAVKWIILIANLFFTISFIYYLAPAKDSKFRFISAGSTLATVLSIVTMLGFNFYVQNFSSYNALYGSIGTLLIILLWIYINSFILLIGFELNASIQGAKKDKTLQEASKTHYLSRTAEES